ncbi:ribonuclease H-like domain-containing protein [Catenaria anguillulae PL171]|uniref:RNA exonuclease 4 n=1 Tax=Catenaria anguillulae PL171 TaxID=765915 RepID=A0A1Y2GYI8_9FUNG|nr:ribonuclease H-like domain-containing protein [Catenaria anguillulae PL171]
MSTSNWAKLKAKIATPTPSGDDASTKMTKANNAKKRKRDTGAGLDADSESDGDEQDAAAAAVARALALTAKDRQSLASMNPERLQIDRLSPTPTASSLGDDATEAADSRNHGGDDEDDDEPDLLDALEKGTPLSLPTHATSTASSASSLLARIPAAFRPTASNPVPTTLMAWFSHLDSLEHPSGSVPDPTKLGKFIAIDCEMVGVGPAGEDSALARVSIVNYHGHVVLDTFVAPQEPVTDYRTQFSGVTASDLVGAPKFRDVVDKVAGIIQGRVVVGHGLHNDLNILLLDHPKDHLRDTSKYHGFHSEMRTRQPALRKLVETYLGLQIQQGTHDSVEDARAAMAVYRLHRGEWDLHVKKVASGEVKVPKNSKQKKSAKHWEKVKGGRAQKRRRKQ